MVIIDCSEIQALKDLLSIIPKLSSMHQISFQGLSMASKMVKKFKDLKKERPP